MRYLVLLLGIIAFSGCATTKSYTSEHVKVEATIDPATADGHADLEINARGIPWLGDVENGVWLKGRCEVWSPALKALLNAKKAAEAIKEETPAEPPEED